MINWNGEGRRRWADAMSSTLTAQPLSRRCDIPTCKGYFVIAMAVPGFAIMIKVKLRFYGLHPR
jgi:hypothetical protein